MAKAFVASRVANRGVWFLSEFTGIGRTVHDWAARFLHDLDAARDLTEEVEP